MLPSAHILVIDDETHIADVVQYVLEQAGFRTSVAYDGEVALQRFETLHPDLVVLDLNLPGRSGLDLFRHFRATRAEVPVIMLTSRDEEVDRVLGLEMGADDYVTKPFSTRELAARVKTVLRRSAVTGGGTAEGLSCGPLLLDPDAFRVAYHGQTLNMTRPEFELMHRFLRHPARTYTRDQLISAIHDEAYPVTNRSIDAIVKRLRRKFAQLHPEGPDPIETVYGIGYKLNGALSLMEEGGS